VYPETLRVGDGETGPDSTVLLPEGADTSVTVSGMTINLTQYASTVRVRGFHFLGLVEHHGVCADNTWNTCRFDQGLYARVSNLGWSSRLLNCLSLGDIYVLANNGLIEGCTVWGTIHADFHDTGGDVRGCHVFGPGAIGIETVGEFGHMNIDDNTVTGFEVGIHGLRSSAARNTVRNCSRVGIEMISGDVSALTAENVVSDIAGDGIVGSTNPPYDQRIPYISNNIVRRCSGNGITGGLLTSNQIDSVGLCGIYRAEGTRYNVVRWSGSLGISIGGDVIGNTVLFAGGDGIHAGSQVEGNVVGRCAGSGIVALRAHGNTSYSNGGDGFVVNGFSYPEDLDTLRNNIAYGNAGYGLRWTGLDSVVVTCNDWFGNGSGTTTGIDPGASDLFADPLFCDLARDSVSLRFDSPMLDAPGCGLIGARGQGCDVSTETLTPGGGSPRDSLLGLALLPPVPTPARRAVAIAYTLPAAMRVDLSVVDVQGRVVARLVGGWDEAGPHKVTWQSGSTAPGVVFAVMRASARQITQRIALIR